MGGWVGAYGAGMLLVGQLDMLCPVCRLPGGHVSAPPNPATPTLLICLPPYFTHARLPVHCLPPLLASPPCRRTAG